MRMLTGKGIWRTNMCLQRFGVATKMNGKENREPKGFQPSASTTFNIPILNVSLASKKRR